MGHVHEEDCDESFSVFLLSNKEWSQLVFIFFYKLEKRMERREMIKRKITNLEKTLKRVIKKKLEK